MQGRHIISVGLLWAGLTAVGELLVFADLFPTVGSEEAKDFDDIFKFLLVLGIPVFMFVVSMVAYAAFMFRSRTRTPSEDGPPMKGTGWVPRLWLAVTGGLAIFVMIYPGLTGLSELQKDSNGYGWGDTQGDVEIQVTAFQWQWTFTYPDGTEVSVAKGKEIVLPVDHSIRFVVNSTDVVHSLWVPVFRMKIDAIPGRTTFMTVRPDVLGDYATDQGFRAQCAELCGLDHGKMMLPIRVVEKAEYDQWLAGLKAGGN